MKTALLFSGQGSQYVGMIKDIYEEYPKAKELVDKADDILGYKLSEICFEGPEDALKQTRNTQPALFLHSAAIVELIKESIEFSAVAGHSVGEYAALFATKVLNFDDALKLVSLRGKLMQEAGEKNSGTMFAVIGLADEKVERVCDELSNPENEQYVVAANYNCPGQLVVSGSADYLREKVGAFKDAGAKIVKELKVSGAFHSPLMEPAKKELEKVINEINFNDASLPVYSNVSAQPLTKSDEIKEALIKQLTSPVRWTQTIKNMEQNGVSGYIEVGAGKVLQGLTKRSSKGAEISGIDKVEDIGKYLV